MLLGSKSLSFISIYVITTYVRTCILILLIWSGSAPAFYFKKKFGTIFSWMLLIFVWSGSMVGWGTRDVLEERSIFFYWFVPVCCYRLKKIHIALLITFNESHPNTNNPECDSKTFFWIKSNLGTLKFRGQLRLFYILSSDATKIILNIVGK